MTSTNNQTSTKEGNNLIRLLAVILLVIIVIILSLRSCGTEPAVVLEPDYATITIDDNAVPMTGSPDEPQERTQVEEGGGSVTISFMDDVRYNLSTGDVSLFYQNPYASTHDVVVQVILISGQNEYLLGQSGLLQPGYEVTHINGAGTSISLSPGGYTGKLKLLFYDPETGERAIVDTDIPTTITVE